MSDKAKVRNQQLILATGVVTILAVFASSYLFGMTVEYLQKAGFAMGVDVGRIWPFMMLLWVPALAYSYWRYR